MNEQTTETQRHGDALYVAWTFLNGGAGSSTEAQVTRAEPLKGAAIGAHDVRIK